MKSWIEPSNISLPDEFSRQIGGNPLVAKTLYRRGQTTTQASQAFLNPEFYQPSSSYDLPGMDIAVERLQSAIKKKETICVWGDFDVDGQTATALLVSALRNLGGQVIYHIPIRATESHGINRPVLEKILDGDQTATYGWIEGLAPPSLILTCDTGISAHEALSYADATGVDVLVTDHHELPPELPSALAMINPKFLAPNHPLNTLPGVGVAYKLAEALSRQYGTHLDEDHALAMVALGVVADLAIQTGEARYLLQLGLQKLRQTILPGIQTLAELAEVNLLNLNEEHIAFELAPRLNALGRLGDANHAVELLTTQDVKRARLLANQLEGMNNQRRLQTELVFQAALSQIEREPTLLDQPALVLSHPSWPSGVIGIVASRLVEHYHKPVALIATPEGALGRGSARSIEGVHITEMLRANAGLLSGYGGHAMAAGFSIDPQQIPVFRRALNRSLQNLGAIPESRLQIDGYLDLKELNLDLVADLERLAPFGMGNPPLILVSRNVRISNFSSVGKNQEHLLLTVTHPSGYNQRVVWWQGAGWPRPEGAFDLAYTVRATSYRGQPAIQVEWVDYRPIVDELQSIPPAILCEAIDHRNDRYPLSSLKKLMDSSAIQVWAEASAAAKLSAQNVSVCSRLELIPSQSLLIWTPPPSFEILTEVFAIVRPQKVYLFSVMPETDRLDELLKRLIGLVKYSLQNQGDYIEVNKLASSLAQREITTRKGLAWMAAMGYISLEEASPGQFHLAYGGVQELALAHHLVEELDGLLAETRAFRAYYNYADPLKLIA